MLQALSSLIVLATLRWSSLQVSLDEKRILAPMDVEANAGKLLGVLGPSGAGKTTLLGVLSGRCEAQPRKRLTGVCSSGIPDAHDVSVLEQAEQFFGLLTVRETLELAMELEGGEGPSARAEVDALLQTLGLLSVQHSRVGDSMHRGISGGEKRRLAVGCALIAHPSLLVADEPTTGLDAHQAARVVRLVRSAASDRSIPAVATLHQPRSSIWAMLDDVLLLAPNGRVVYMGARDGALRHFAKLGHPCPPATNPAEHLIDLVSVDHDEAEGAAADEARINVLAALWRKKMSSERVRPSAAKSTALASSSASDGKKHAAVSRRKRPKPLRRLFLLLRRSWRQNIRDGWVNSLRLAVSSGLALVFGELFGRFGPPTPSQLAERIALLSYASINMAMMSLMKTLDLLGREKHVVDRERARGQYGSFEYVIAKMVTELPLDASFAAGFGALLHWRIGLRLPMHVLVGTLSLTAACSAGLGLALGALAPTADSALALGIPVMIVHMVLGIINPSGAAESKPPSLGVRLCSHLSPIKWSIRALCCSELRGLEIEQRSLKDAPRIGGLALVKSGDEVLERLGMETLTSAVCCQRLGKLLAAELAVAWLGLKLGRTRYAELEPPASEDEAENKNQTVS